MSIATRTGDTGATSLLHGQRVPKDHPQIEAVGAFDELNVEIGAARIAAIEANERKTRRRRRVRQGPGGERMAGEQNLSPLLSTAQIYWRKPGL